MDVYRMNMIKVFCVCIVGSFLVNFGLLATAVQAQKKVKLSLVIESGDKNSPAGKSMKLFADLIEKRSDGKIRANVFYQGELGGQQELFDQLVKGNIDVLHCWPQTSYDERLAVNYIPYLVIGWKDAMQSYGRDGWVKKLVEPIFADLNLKYLGPYPEGFGGIATKKRYATNFEDAQGLKVRSQPIFPMPQTIKALGFQPVPIDWAEVYTSIQTGVVDGDSSNVIFWDVEYFGDQLDYYVHSEHNFSSYSWLMNNEKWNRLSPEFQKIVEESAMEVINKQFEDAQAWNEEWIRKAQEKGMEYIRPTEKEKLAWVKKVRAEVWPMIEEKIGKDVMV